MNPKRLLIASVSAVMLVLPLAHPAAAYSPTSFVFDSHFVVDSPGGVASRVEQLGRQYPQDYGGQYVDLNGKHIVNVVQGRQEFLATLDRAGLRRQVILRQVRNSTSDLDRLTAQLTADKERLGAKGLSLVQWGPDETSNLVRVFLGKARPGAQAMFDTIYGESKISVAPTLATPAERYDRFHDFSPFWGADRIWSSTHNCTSGAIMRDSAGKTYALTAGHCGAVGTTWRTNVTYKYVLGTESKRSFSSGGLDTAAISATASGYVWRNGTSYYHQGGEFYPAVGSYVCADGSYSGEVCSVKIQYVNICKTFSDGITTCHMNVAHRDAINVAQDGDSGGPVYGGTSGGDTYISGTIVGGANSNTTVYYQLINYIDSAFGLAIKR